MFHIESPAILSQSTTRSRDRHLSSSVCLSLPFSPSLSRFSISPDCCCYLSATCRFPTLIDLRAQPHICPSYRQSPHRNSHELAIMASYVKIATFLRMNSSQQSSPDSYEGSLPYNSSTPSIRSCPIPVRQSASISFGFSSGNSSPTSRSPSTPKSGLLSRIATSLSLKQQNGSFYMPNDWNITQRPPNVDPDIDQMATALRTEANRDMSGPLPADHKSKLWHVLSAYTEYKNVSELLVYQLLETEKKVQMLEGKVSNLQAHVSMLEDDAEALEDEKNKIIKAREARIAELMVLVQEMEQTKQEMEEDKHAQEKAHARKRAQHTEQLPRVMTKGSEELVFMVTGRVPRSNTA